MSATDMMNTMWRIRPAREEEAPQLAELARRIFFDTFGQFNSPSDMEIYGSQVFTPAVIAEAIGEPRTDILVAAHGDDLIAYAQLYRGEAPPVVAGTAPIELKRFYVLQGWHGTGLAGALMGAVTELSRKHGADTLWLGVWEQNLRAIHFYRKHGFAEVGEQPFLLGTDWQRDLIMAAALDAPAETSS